MSINYYLKKLVDGMPGAGKYVAQVRVNETMSLQGLIDAVAVRKTGIGRGDIASVIETLCEVIESEVVRGNIVQLGGIVRLWATIKGAFDTESTPFDPSLHTLNVAAAANSRMQRALQNEGTVNRISKVVHTPQLGQFSNATASSSEEIGTFTVCQIDGDDLDFDDTDSTQGVFVVDATAGGGPDVKVNTLPKAGSKQIIFQTPDLTGYTEVNLEVRRRQRPDGQLLTGSYDSSLYVINPPVAAGV